MAKLTYEQRKKLPSSSFARPGERKYPLDTKNRAKNALARVSQFGTESEKKAVRAKVHKKFPGIKIKGRSASTAKMKGKNTRKYSTGKR